MFALLWLPLASKAHAEPIVPSEGQVIVDLQLEQNQRVGKIGEPVSIAPDFYYGLSDEWHAAFVHSFQSRGRLWHGSGLCLSPDNEGCIQEYDNFRALVRRRLHASNLLSVWMEAGIGAEALVPTKWTLHSGGLITIHHRRIRAQFQPLLSGGLNNLARGNRSRLTLPLWLSGRVAGPLRLGIYLAIDAPLEDYSEYYVVPAAAYVSIEPGRLWGLIILYGATRAQGPRQTLLQRALVISLKLYTD